MPKDANRLKNIAYFAWAATADHAIQRVEVPFRDSVLRVGSTGPLPTVLAGGGTDALREIVVVQSGDPWLASRFGVLAIDGPDQGEAACNGVHVTPRCGGRGRRGDGRLAPGPGRSGRRAARERRDELRFALDDPGHPDPTRLPGLLTRPARVRARTPARSSSRPHRRSRSGTCGWPAPTATRTPSADPSPGRSDGR